MLVTNLRRSALTQLENYELVAFCIEVTEVALASQSFNYIIVARQEISLNH